jgi:tetratricopeptide (TPR) repeat protein
MTPLCNAVIQTKEALDSLDRFPPPDDERLYQTGRNWLYYLQQTAFGEYPSFEKAYDFFRQLLRQYPKSPWADRAEHGLFTYIDHHQVATDDTWPEGDDKRARVEFVRFLHEYPASAKRSDIMYRLTNILLHSNDYDQAECYLDTIARMDPEFTRRAPDFAVKLRAIERFKYSKKWFFKAVQLPNVVRCGDSLRFVLQCCNLNKMDQPIDSTLKTCLINNAVVYLTREQKPGCEYWPGINVPLNCIQPPDLRATIVIKPGACFDAKYSLPVLCHPAPNEIGKPGRYKYQLALQHELFYQAIRQRAGEMLEIQE